MLKQEILGVLRAAGGYVSGQQLCEQFKVSRTAVWKKIRQLQSEGYVIEAVPNLGYRLAGCPDTIAAEEIASRLTTKWIAKDIRYFETIDSTNRYARLLGEQGEKEGVLVVADEQSLGRGRSGRTWSTPRGSAIAMTLLLRPSIAPERVSMVTLIMGMAIAEAVRELYGINAGIKWPNDVVAGDKKLSGTLTEMSCELSSVSYIVIGTGINVNMKSFPEELAGKAVSIAQLLGRETSRAELVALVMSRFESYYESFLETQDLRALETKYNAILANAGCVVRVLSPGSEFEGMCRGINRMGRLLVETEDNKVQEVYAGEVSVRGINGYV